MSYYEEVVVKDRRRSNRYRKCPVYADKETGEYVLGTRDVTDIPKSTYDSYHKVNAYEACRLDLIAYKYYNNQLLWWIIAQANDIHDPFNDVVPGMVLRIPNLTTLYGGVLS